MKIVINTLSTLEPPDRGGDRHVVGMARALGALGYDVHFTTWKLGGARPQDFSLPYVTLTEGPPADASHLSALQRRFQRYYNATPERVGALRAEMKRFGAEVCIRAGPDGGAYLAGMPEMAKIWYCADELLLGYLGILFGSGKLPWSLGETLHGAAMNALGERALAAESDEIWTVTERDQLWMRRVSGNPRVRVVANGVDLEYFTRPAEVEVRPNRLAFWGRLDFRVNQTALKWFFDRVWPGVKREVPQAEMLVVGFAPTDFVRTMCDRPDVELVPGPEDLRGWVCSSRIAVQPFVSGGGIKNKLLEAASLGHAIVGTQRAMLGLRRGDEEAWIESDSPREWTAALTRLLRDPEEARRRGEAARRWVEERHTWEAAARIAEQGIEAALRRRRERLSR